MRRSTHLPLCPVCRHLYLATFAEQIAGVCVVCERNRK